MPALCPGDVGAFKPTLAPTCHVPSDGVLFNGSGVTEIDAVKVCGLVVLLFFTYTHTDSLTKIGVKKKLLLNPGVVEVPQVSPRKTNTCPVGKIGLSVPRVINGTDNASNAPRMHLQVNVILFMLACSLLFLLAQKFMLLRYDKTPVAFTATPTVETTVSTSPAAKPLAESTPVILATPPAPLTRETTGQETEPSGLITCCVPSIVAADGLSLARVICPLIGTIFPCASNSVKVNFVAFCILSNFPFAITAFGAESTRSLSTMLSNLSMICSNRFLINFSCSPLRKR